MTTAFVTGGSGFVGRNLIGYLKDHGWRVLGLARSADAASKVVASGAEPIRGDLDDDQFDVTASLSGVDVIFHAAANVDDWAPFEAAWKTNVVGTERLLEGARKAGVKRFVQVSTEAVLIGSPMRQLKMADESWPLPARPLGVYSQTKGAAEQRVLAANGAGLETVVIRPRFIWGRGDTSLLPRLVEATRSGDLMWMSGSTHLTSTCHVRNVCEGALKAAEKGAPGGIYFLTDGAPQVFRTFISAMLETQGVTPPKKSAPRPLVHAFAIATDAAYRFLPLKGRPALTHAAFHLIGEEVTVNDAKARRELGYTAELSIEQGLAEMRSTAA